MTNSVAVHTPTEPTNPPSGDSAVATTPVRRAKREMFASSATVVAFLAVFAIYSIWLGSGFLDVDARMFDVAHSAPQLMLSAGLVVCLACHQFDLSVGAMATLSVFLTIGLHVKSDWPMGLAIAAALLAGATGGLINGLLVTKVRLNAFIATLGTGGIFGGLTVVYSSGQVIGPSPNTGTLPRWFTGPGSMGDFQNKVPDVLGWAIVAVVLVSAAVSIDQRFINPGPRRTVQRALVGGGAAILVALTAWCGIVPTIAWPMVILVTLATLLWVFLKYTTTGRSAYAIGGNPRAASFAGIRTDAITVLVFVISGTVAAMAGVLLAAVQGSAVPGIADPLLLPAYAAVFLSTVLISRGRFHIWGTVTGGLFLLYVAAGLVEGGVKFTWTQVINGVVLVATVSLSTLLRKK